VHGQLVAVRLPADSRTRAGIAGVRTLLLVSIGALLGIVIGVALVGGHGRGAGTTEVAPLPAAPPPPVRETFLAEASDLGYVGEVERVQQEVPPPPPAPTGQTARAFLAGYYGERWPQVEQDMDASGIDLDVPYAFTPWEEVAPEFEQSFRIPADELRDIATRKLDWPEDLGVEWIRENYPVRSSAALTAEDLAAIEERAVGHNAEIQALADEYVVLLDLAMRERWSSGRILRSPFTTMGISKDMGFYSKSVGGHGWAATITLKREDYPELVALDDRIAARRDERDRAVARYLRDRSSR
jgi:hypothetical protein